MAKINTKETYWKFVMWMAIAGFVEFIALFGQHYNLTVKGTLNMSLPWFVAMQLGTSLMTALIFGFFIAIWYVGSVVNE